MLTKKETTATTPSTRGFQPAGGSHAALAGLACLATAGAAGRASSRADGTDERQTAAAGHSSLVSKGEEDERNRNETKMMKMRCSCVVVDVKLICEGICSVGPLGRGSNMKEGD